MSDYDTILTVRPEKPAAGGRMIARHDGRVLLVSGAIPDELVRVRLTRVERSLAYADVVAVLEPHPSRRPVPYDPRCGGATLAHLTLDAQRQAKALIVTDALRRLGRIDWTSPVDVVPSPETGYRMRARLHLRDRRVGFFLEGTHHIGDAWATGQLLESTQSAVEGVVDDLCRAGFRGEAELDVSENVAGDERAIHVELEPDARIRTADLVLTAAGISGLSLSSRGVGRTVVVAGDPFVCDTLPLSGAGSAPLLLRRHARAFFQSNRFLLQPLAGDVVSDCLPGPAIDLYAGVGLFGVAIAARGTGSVDAVEGHHPSAVDLRTNAAPFGETIRVHEMPVERFVERRLGEPPATLIVDPPRTGMTRDALTGALALGASRVVCVSCDVATFARDLRRWIDGGYRIERLRAYDLFPNTAHVEMVAVLDRTAGPAA